MSFFPTSLKFVGCGVFFLWSISVYSFAIANHVNASTPDGLGDLVHDYLFEEDMTKARELNDSIVNHPDASVFRVSRLIRTSRKFSPASVGLQPNRHIEVDGLDHSFGLYVPSSYKPEIRWPLVVCLHGAGFTGDAYLERWAPRLGEGYILACPTLSMGAWWTRLGEDLVLAVIKAVQARYHIDPNRVYLTGMSNGGIGAWIIGMHHAHRFAGVAPMASGIDEVLYPFLENLRQVPLYIIHGAKDQIMPVWLSRNVTNELARLGVAYVYREHEWTHPHAGAHFFPRQELPELIAWFDEQRRDPHPLRQTVVRDASHLSEFGWVRIDATERIAMFSEQLMDQFDHLIKNRIYARLDAEIRTNNHIEITTDRVLRFTLFLNDKLVDLSRPVVVTTNGRVNFEGPVTPQVETVLHEARQREDFATLYPVKLTLDVTH